jgi:hypothetical protein
MTNTRRPKPRRMSSILSTLGGRECFPTEAAWHEYQEVLHKLKMKALAQTMEGGEETRPSRGNRGARGARGFNRHQPNKRKKAN